MPPEYIIGIIAIITIFIIVLYVLNSKHTTTTQYTAETPKKQYKKPLSADVRINMYIGVDGSGTVQLTIIPKFLGDPNVATINLKLSKGNSICSSDVGGVNGVLVKIQSISVAKNLLSIIVTNNDTNTPVTIIFDTSSITNGNVASDKGTVFDTSKISINTGMHNGKNLTAILFHDNNNNKLEFSEYS